MLMEKFVAHFAIFPTYDGEFVAESPSLDQPIQQRQTSSVDAVADRMPQLPLSRRVRHFGAFPVARAIVGRKRHERLCLLLVS